MQIFFDGTETLQSMSRGSIRSGYALIKDVTRVFTRRKDNNVASVALTIYYQALP